MLLALSGGADSVLLLHLLAAAAATEVHPPLIRAVHVNHGLRGAESEADERFCANLCRALGIPFRAERIELESGAGSLEARARAARYRVLANEALRTRHLTVLTGHHADDALETLLLRWVRGTGLHGLRGPHASLELTTDAAAAELHGADATKLRVVRPLLALRREEVRRLLSDHGLAWREDRSNDDVAFTRNRVRKRFLPFLEEVGGPELVDNLRAFGRAVEDLEHELAAATAHLAWRPPSWVTATRGPWDRELGGVLARGELMRLARPLRRRALWRLLAEGTGAGPNRTVLEKILLDLGAGKACRHALPADWTLVLRADELQLLPPASRRQGRARLEHPQQGWLPFAEGEARPADEGDSRPLAVPGQVRLADGRTISAELVRVDAPVPRQPEMVELDATDLPRELSVRWPRAGDRFHGLGAPGSKRLSRFLADRGIPREERPWVPLVSAGPEILWVTGLSPNDRRRVRPETRQRLRLTLHDDGTPAHGCEAGLGGYRLPFSPPQEPGDGGRKPSSGDFSRASG